MNTIHTLTSWSYTFGIIWYQETRKATFELKSQQWVQQNYKLEN